MSETENVRKLPVASGHRFGPELVCGECGLTWDDHQRKPEPCEAHEPVESLADTAKRRRVGTDGE